jgi:hypothetical protein
MDGRASIVRRGATVIGSGMKDIKTTVSERNGT